MILIGVKFMAVLRGVTYELSCGPFELFQSREIATGNA